MSIDFVASARNYVGGASSVTVSKPAGVVPGDLMVAACTFGAGGGFNAPGWTVLHTDFVAGSWASTILYRVAAASEPASYTFSSGTSQSVAVEGAIVAYRNVDTSAPIDVSARTLSSNVSPDVTTAVDNALLVAIRTQGYGGPGSTAIGTPAGMTRRQPATLSTAAAAFADEARPLAGATGTRTFTGGDTNYGYVAYSVAVAPNPNVAPNSPILTSLTGGEVIDRAAANRASHTFSDPDAGDSQSAFDHRYRLVGAATWTTAYVASPNTFHDYPAGTFAAGDYERQVRTYDSQGVVGPWSASGFFTAADAPATPTITDPIQNETISADSRDVTWSAPQQDAYQLQVLDGGLVEHDSGTVVTTQRTAYGVPFPDNNVGRSIRVRVRYGGLWSSWYTIAVSVSYTAPPVPSVQLTASGTAIVVQVTNPAPGAGEPAVSANDVFVTEDGTEQRRAVVTPNGSWTYWLPKAGLDYTPLVRVEAIGDNGTRSSS